MKALDSKEIKVAAKTLGFDLVAVIQTRSTEKEETFLGQWVKAGYHGEMRYLADFGKRHKVLLDEMPDAKSIIVFAVNYFSRDCGESGESTFLKGRISRYASGKDYHRLIREKLADFEKYLKKRAPSVRSIACADAEPLFERSCAEAAGFGFRGKNTNLLNPDFGPWLFLAEIITNLELAPDFPKKRGSCGKCSRCLEACPTGAIVEPYIIDARRCIAYLTIEHKGIIPRELRPLMKDRLFGCDACLEVCPFSRFAKETSWQAFRPEEGAGLRADLFSLFRIKNNREYGERFRHSPILRASRKMLLRNAAVVFGNLKDARAIPVLREALEKEVPLVRIHAAWALGRIGENDCRGILASRLECEENPEVKEELRLSLTEMKTPKTGSASPAQAGRR